jgi:hypothetical protein
MAGMEATWARSKIKEFLYREVEARAAACVCADLPRFVERHAAPDINAGAHATSFARMVLKSVSIAISSGQPHPPVEWLHGWAKHTYSPGGAAYIRPFLLYTQYPEAARLEWLRGSISNKEKDSFQHGQKDTAAILAIPSFHATIVLFRLLIRLKKKSQIFSIGYVIRDMYAEGAVGNTYLEIIEHHAPLLFPHWGTITLLGLNFQEAHTLVFGSPDKVVDLPADLVFST